MLEAGESVPSSTILLMSFPADIADGNSYESRTTIFPYPLRARCRAVELPHVPHPMIRIVEVGGSRDFDIFEHVEVQASKLSGDQEGFVLGCPNVSFPCHWK